MIKPPYELVIQFENYQQSKPPPSKSRIKRSKNGCFNCRKRKKKCDEVKPACASCSSRCIPCVWPKDSHEKLPKEYKIPEVDKVLENEKYARKTFIAVDFEEINKPHQQEVITEDEGSKELAPLMMFHDESLDFLSNMESSGPMSGTSPNEFTPEPLDSESYASIEPYTKNLLGKELCITLNIEDNFKSACINGFITSLGPQYTHPLLTTTATFTPFLDNNPIMESITSACGCAFLSWSDPTLANLSFEKYNKASRMMKKYLATPNLVSKDNIWLCAGWQLLCLCSKISLFGTSRHTNDNLRMCYQTIKMIVNSSNNNGIDNGRIGQITPIMGPELDSQVDYFEDFSRDNLKMEIEHSLIHFEHQSNPFYLNKQFERMFIESFIYNYSVGILISSAVDDLPNPFFVFRDFRNALKTPLFSCDVAWMNNPVCGAAFDSFELAAKASYLIRHLGDPTCLLLAKRLYDVATFQPLPMIPVELRGHSNYQDLKDSVLIGEVVMRAAKIILLKVIDITISSSDVSIQAEVEIILKKLQQTSRHSRCKIISTWAIFVCGVACINYEQRQYLVENAIQIGELVHGCHVFSILKALDIAWGRDQAHYLSGKGIDVLLDGEFLSQLKF